MSLFDLTGKIALVTGGARDIGCALSMGLAKQGADIVVNYGSSEKEANETVKEIEKLGRRAIAVRADVTKKEDLDKLVAESLKFGNGKIDILVNNAGGLIKRSPFEDLPVELLDSVFKLNFTSVIQLCQLVIPIMVKNGGGRVINITSVAAHQGGSTTACHYASAKAALTNVARTLSKEYASKNVTVNSVAPGVINNSFHKQTPKDMIESWVKTIPMGRAGTNEDVCGAVAFLASPSASYITGQVIHVNGGWHFGN